MKSIRFAKSPCHKCRCLNDYFRSNGDVRRCSILPFEYLLLPRWKWAVRDLLAQYVAPGVFDYSQSHHPLNMQLRFRFQANAELVLLVEWPVVAAIVEVNAHEMVNDWLLVQSSELVVVLRWLWRGSAAPEIDNTVSQIAWDCQIRKIATFRRRWLRRR